MKSFKMTIVLLLALFAFSSIVNAQDDSPFREGTVFQITMIKTEANSQDNYLKMLNSFYLPMMQMAKEKGLIKSYKVLKGTFANEDDFDVMMMIEFESMAMMDPDESRDAAWDAISDALTEKMGGKEKVAELTSSYPNIREFRGQKLMREVLIKK